MNLEYQSGNINIKYKKYSQVLLYSLKIKVLWNVTLYQLVKPLDPEDKVPCSLKCQQLITWKYVVTSQNTLFFSSRAVRTTNLIYSIFLHLEGYVTMVYVQLRTKMPLLYTVPFHLSYIQKNVLSRWWWKQLALLANTKENSAKMCLSTSTVTDNGATMNWMTPLLQIQAYTTSSKLGGNNDNISQNN